MLNPKGLKMISNTSFNVIQHYTNMHVIEVTEESPLIDRHAIFFHTCLWSIVIGSILILYMSYHTSGTQTIMTGISSAMLCIEILTIACKHPVRYEWVRDYMEIVLRINICHLIMISTFIYYINYVDFSTYFVMVCAFTLPILILSVTAILRESP
jgi:hypothetical protein